MLRIYSWILKYIFFKLFIRTISFQYFCMLYSYPNTMIKEIQRKRRMKYKNIICRCRIYCIYICSNTMNNFLHEKQLHWMPNIMIASNFELSEYYIRQYLLLTITCVSVLTATVANNKYKFHWNLKYHATSSFISIYCCTRSLSLLFTSLNRRTNICNIVCLTLNP